MEKIVVFDVGNPLTAKNKLFDRDFVYPISHTFLPICHLSEKAHQHNITFITPDVFLNDLSKFENKKVFLISQLTNSNTKKLLEAGVIPLLLLCQESPFIATRFYLDLKRISALFKYSIVFSGMKKRLNKKTKYKQMFFPQSEVEMTLTKPNFFEKKFLTMISSAKSIGSWRKNLLLKLLYGTNIKAINFFSHNNDFDLFGYSWNNLKATKIIQDAIKKTYRGTVDNKQQTLKNYRFALCFENSVFPGYITEKIFDCFFAGVVPIYYGAPDIDKDIPSNTFIDFKKFDSYEKLEAFLEEIDEYTYSLYIDNIENFLKSEQFYLFSQNYFTDTVINLINAE